jgi:radical SAM protein with 4Fe4S-binding SPASM domain
MAVAARLRRLYARLVASGDSWDHFLATVTRESLSFEPALDGAAKRALFRRNVTLVELEPHAYCNRTCAFCPNAVIDRLTVKTRLDRGLYERVLRDLQTIEYAGVLRFARYSEPLADAHIYEMLAMARQALPRATIDLISNGDFLTPERLRALRESGLSILRISVYLRKGVRWSREAARDEVERVGRRLGIAPRWSAATDASVGAVFPYEGLEVVAFSHDFDAIGYDRGQLLGDLTDAAYVRRSPCFMVFSNFTVDFDGKVMPCCNLRGDHPAHAGYVVGDLSASEVSIFDVYASRVFTEWRRSLAGVGDKADPCRTCKQKALDGAELERLERALGPRLRRAGLAP